MPRHNQLREDPALKHASEINRSLVKPLISQSPMDNMMWETLQEKMGDNHWFAFIDSDVEMKVLRAHSTKNGGVNPVTLEGAVVMVARNLYKKDLQYTDENVKAEVERIIEVRERIANNTLFSGDVVLSTHGEVFYEKKGINKPGDVRFGSETLVKAIQERVSDNHLFNHFSSAKEGAESAKMNTLKVITENLNDLTVIFDGHGGPDAFYYTDGQIVESTDATGKVISWDTSIKITADEFASALIERHERIVETTGDNGAPQRIKLIFSACYMNDLIDKISKKLTDNNVPVPDLSLSASERGQAGYSNFKDEYGSKINRWFVESGNLKSLIESEENNDSNPSIFVPDPTDPTKPMQISGAVVPQNTMSA